VYMYFVWISEQMASLAVCSWFPVYAKSSNTNSACIERCSYWKNDPQSLQQC